MSIFQTYEGQAVHPKRQRFVSGFENLPAGQCSQRLPFKYVPAAQSSVGNGLGAGLGPNDGGNEGKTVGSKEGSTVGLKVG